MISCKQCGMEFEPEHPLIKFCSNVCRAIGYAQHGASRSAKFKDYRHKLRAQLLDGLPRRKCPVCGDLFHPKSLRQHICSERCRAEREEIKIKEWINKLASIETNSLVNKDSCVVRAIEAASEAQGEDKE